MNNDKPLSGVLLVSDIDGTFLTKEFTIPKRNIEAVERFCAKGGLFSFATGREQEAVSRYLDRVHINAPSIIDNGAAVYDFGKKQAIWNTYIPEKYVSLIREAIAKFPDIGAEIFAENTIFLVSENDWTKAHAKSEAITLVPAKIAEVPDNWNKVLFASDHTRLMDLKAFFDSHETDDLYHFFSNTMYYEMLRGGVSKGSTLDVLTGLLADKGVKKENVYAIGDYFNDLDLVTHANFSAVPGGAPQELKKAADLIVCRCEDGAVADFIEYIESRYGA